MKLLDTEQQTQLRELLVTIVDTFKTDGNVLPSQIVEAEYWVQELKPKRVRRKAINTQEEVASNANS